MSNSTRNKILFNQSNLMNRPASFASSNNAYSLVFEDGIPIRKYEFSSQAFCRDFEIYQWRRIKNRSIARVLGWSQQQMVSHSYSKIIIFTEHFTKPLQDIRNLSIHEAVYLLREAIYAYQFIFHKFGFVSISEKVCGVNFRGQFLAWINENLALNKSTSMVFTNETAIIKKIIQMVHFKTECKEHIFFHNLLSVESTFQSTLNFISQTASRMTIPNFIDIQNNQNNVSKLQQFSTRNIIETKQRGERYAMKEANNSLAKINSCSLKEISVFSPRMLPTQLQSALKVNFSYSKPLLSQKIVTSKERNTLITPLNSSTSNPNKYYQQEPKFIQQFRLNQIKSSNILEGESKNLKKQRKKLRNNICSNVFTIFHIPNTWQSKSQICKSKYWMGSNGSCSPVYKSLKSLSDAKTSIQNIKYSRTSMNLNKQCKFNQVGDSLITKKPFETISSYFADVSEIQKQSDYQKSFIQKSISKDNYNFGGLLQKCNPKKGNEGKNARQIDLEKDEVIHSFVQNSNHKNSQDSPRMMNTFSGYRNQQYFPQNQWITHIKQLINSQDQNMKESVHCGPELRKQPIKLEMLGKFGRQISQSCIPHDDDY